MRLVLHQAHVRQGKLEQKWRPYYRIVEQTGPVTFKIWDQLRNKVKNNDIKRATIEVWGIPEVTVKERPIRHVTLAGPSRDLGENDSEMQVELVSRGTNLKDVPSEEQGSSAYE